MDLPHFDIRQKVIAELLTDPETRHSLQLFVSSDEGKRIIEDCLNSPEGHTIIRELLDPQSCYPPPGDKGERYQSS